jgi:hypothetical protein
MHTSDSDNCQYQREVLSKLDKIISLLQQIAGQDPYAISEPPISLILKSSSTGQFLLYRTTNDPFDLPVDEKKQSLTGVLRELKLVRAPNSKHNPAIPINPEVPESLSHTPFVIVTIATSKGVLAINVGSAGSVASRTLLAIIANATPEQLAKPVRLTLSAGTIERNAVLVEMRDCDSRPISSEGANVGKSGMPKYRLVRSLIDRAFQKLPSNHGEAIALFDAIHSNQDPEDFMQASESQESPLDSLSRELDEITDPEMLRARMTRARQEFPGLLPQLVDVYNQHRLRIGG